MSVKTRLSNVGATLKAALTGKGVSANVPKNAPIVTILGKEKADKVLSAAASNPYTTAAAVSIARAPKLAVSAVKSTLSSLTPKQKIAAALITPAVVSLAVSNPKGTAKAIAETPSQIAGFTSNVYETIKDPTKENLMSIYKENPLIAGVATGAAALVAGKAIQAAYYGSEILDTGVKAPEVKTSKEVALPSSPQVQTKPLESGQLVNVSRSVASRSITRSKKTPSFAPSLRVNIYNQTKSTKFIKFSKYTN